MKNFYVFWRGDEDDFFGTVLTFEDDFDVRGLTNQQWVQMAFDAEYHGELNPFVGDNAASYDLIEIVGGDNIQFYMK